MPLMPLTLGVENDKPMMGAEPWIWSGVNIRVRAGAVETLGLFGPIKDVAGNQIVLPGTGIYREVFTSPSTTEGQIVIGSNEAVQLLQYDPTSTPVTGRRWEVYDVTPPALPAATDTITDPSSGRIEIAPVWWFSDLEDLIIGSRADVVADTPYYWDRNSTNTFIPIPASAHPDGTSAPTPMPQGAVGGGIINRILVLLGCTSETDTDPSAPIRYMTVRWSDRSDFGQWTAWDTTASGELQLEGGTRIVGGGVAGYGVIVWTDKRMALLSETFDNNVFSRRYIDGGRGLMANRAWCEVDGRIWWLDEARTLNVFDGGRPRQVINTNKYASIERLSDPQAARVYLTPNPEFGEVIISYALDDATEVTTQLVYNYLFDCWYFWSLERTGWHARVGVIRPVAVDQTGAIWQHDFDVTFPLPWGSQITPPNYPQSEDIQAYDWEWTSNLITQPNPGMSSWHSTKITLDVLHAQLVQDQDEEYTIEVIGYREPVLTETTVSETHEFGGVDHISMRNYRIGGKAIQVKASGAQQKTVWRFGMIDITGAMDGER